MAEIDQLIGFASGQCASGFFAKIAAVCAFLAASLCPLASRAAFEVNDPEWEGTSELLDIARGELGRDRVEIVGTLDYGKLEANDGVLVLKKRHTGKSTS